MGIIDRLGGDPKQCAIDETKSNGNPTLAVAWALIYIGDQLGKMK